MDNTNDKDIDFDGSGDITWMDFLHFANSGAMSTMLGDPGYDPKYDMNDDDRIDMEDVHLMLKRIPPAGQDPPLPTEPDTEG